MKLRVETMLLVWVMAIAATVSTAAEPQELSVDPQLEFLGVLQQRSLTGLSEAFAEKLLTHPGISVQTRAETTLEVAGAVSMRGSKIVESDQRHQLWAKADRMVEQFTSAHPDFPRMPLFQYRYAGQLLSRSNIASELAKILPEDQTLQQDALAWATKARDLMETVRSEVRKATTQDNLDRNGLSFDELASLSTAADFRTGVAWLAIARAATSDAERQQAVSKVEQFLRGFTAVIANQDITLESHLALAEAYELAGRTQEAIALLNKFDEVTDISQSYVAKAHLQLSRLLLQADKVDAALRILQVPEDLRVPGAEWELMLFEALLRQGAGLWKSSPARAEEFQQQALEILDNLEGQYGRYWGRRGEKTLAKYGNLTGDNLRVLRRLANVLRAEGKDQEALANYTRAAHLAKLQKQPDLVAELEYATASLLSDLDRNQEATEVFLRLAREHRQHELAPTALIQAAYASGRIWTKDGSDKALQDYKSALATALEWFPDDENVQGEANWLLGQMHEQKQDFAQAVEHYRLIPASHRRFGAALSAVATVFHDRLLLAKTPILPLTDARQVLQEVLDRADAYAESGNALATARFVQARLLATDPQPQHEQAEKILRELLQSSDLTAAMRSLAWSAMLELSWKQGKADQCHELVAEVEKEMFPSLMRVLAGLEPTDSTLSSEQRQAQVSLIRSACEKLFANPDALSTNDRINLRLILGKAHVAAGEHDQAKELLQRLRVEAPRDPRVVELLATSTFLDGQFSESEKYWQLLEKGYQRGSLPWLNAVYHLIHCIHQRGDNARAAKLLAATEAFYPDFGNDELKEKFLTLKAVIKRP